MNPIMRTFARVLAVLGFVWIGWVVGHAQAQTASQSAAPKPAEDPALLTGANFELLVTTTNGETRIACVRRCKLTWSPTQVGADGKVQIHLPGGYVSDAASPQGCIAPSWWPQNCRILGWPKP